MDVINTMICVGGVLSTFVLTNTITGVLSAEEIVHLRAQNIKWLSINFKTLLVWHPLHSSCTYTVELFEQNQDFKRNPNCIRSEETECDLTNELSPLNRTYSAIVQSEPVAETKPVLVEFPFVRSSWFNPYRDSHIGPVEFRLQVEEEGRTVRLFIFDPMTPLYRDSDHITLKSTITPLLWAGQLLTVRDILQNDLKYRIIYNKAGSTGKKEVVSDLSVMELKPLDPGQTYCFSIAAYIPSRPSASRLGDWSQPQCTPRGQPTLLQELSIWGMAGALFTLFTSTIFIITLIVLSWRHYCTCTKTGPSTSQV